MTDGNKKIQMKKQATDAVGGNKLTVAPSSTGPTRKSISTSSGATGVK
jgi:hypothetical protein